MSTFMAKPATVERDWFLIDCTDQVVGRLAVLIADLLRGKHKPEYTPHIDTGDFVILINAEQIKFTGKKWDQKAYQRYTHYTSGLKVIPAREMHDKHPGFVITEAVRRMVPRNRLGRAQMAKLKVYEGNSHPHQAQDPKELAPELKARLES